MLLYNNRMNLFNIDLKMIDMLKKHYIFVALM